VSGVTDDLGEAVSLPHPPRRIVSLVPSLTDAIASVDRTLLVAATQWCTHPADLSLPRIRGTKNPDLAAIAALSPDLVIANQEENRRLDVERLRRLGIPVWVTRIESIEDAFAALRRLFNEALGVAAPSWLDQAEDIWSQPPSLQLRAAILIWRDPWMAVGAPTFTDSLAARLGLTNIFRDRAGGRYPHITPDELGDAEVVLLPDEPYAFSTTNGPDALPGCATRLVSGRLLTWYGPSLLEARPELTAAIAD